MERNKTKELKPIFYQMLIIILGIVYIIPIYFLIINSFKTASGITIYPMDFPNIDTFTMANMGLAIEKMSFFRSLLNNIIICGSQITILIFLSSMAAYPLAKKITKLNRKIYLFFLLGVVVPSGITMVPICTLLQSMSLVNTYTGIILVYLSASMPYAVFMYTGFISQIPNELEDAAVVDGCTTFKMFWLIVFPLLKNATITVGVLNLLGSWNDFLMPLILLHRKELRPLVTQIYYFKAQYTTEWGPLFAGMLLSTLPFVMLYVFAQKYILSGISAGALKG